MYSIRTDVIKNRLYIALTGSFTLDEAKKCMQETIAAASKLKKGYDVITDISQLKVSTSEVAKEIEKAQAYFVSSGARQGVRIVENSVITAMQFKRTAGNAMFTSINVSSLEEAEKLLNSI